MKAYIFDLDGTLLDSLWIWDQIDVDFLKKRGIEVPPDYIDAIYSMSFPESAEYTISRFGLPDKADDLMREWNDMAAYAYGNTIPLKPYAREYLHALKEKGVKLGVATSLPVVLYEPALKNNGLYELFDVICSSDEAACGKTKPDIFLLAARKLGVDPRDCIVFEDNPQAMQSAKQAGMTVYGIYDETSKEQWQMITRIADGTLYDFKDAPLPD